MAALPERTAQSYGPAVTSASKAVLLEVMATLRAYREALVLVGGWAPYFLLDAHRAGAAEFLHVGSIDIDLAVDPAAIAEPEYATIAQLLTARGYRPVAGKGREAPRSLERTVLSPVTAKPYTIRVDFLTRPDPSTRTAHQAVQDDLFARKVKGCEAAFTHRAPIELSGTLPDGGTMSLSLGMADLTGILTMKGIVLGERFREKDAYDIYALMKHYGDGPREVAACLAPFREEPLLRESLANIEAAFGRRTAHGPAWVASFLVSAVFGAERERLITDAHMVVTECLRHVQATG